MDEVADLPISMQVKLLRAIQEKKIRPIGSTQEIAVDVRLLSATHKNLAKLVETGEFRQDLYYRINVIEVKLPSLNERRDDILLLANHFIALIAEDWGLSQPPTLSNEAAVQLFLNEKISFLQIEGIIKECLEKIPYKEIISIDEMVQLDTEIKESVLNHYKETL